MLWQSRLTPQNAVLRSPPDGSAGGFGTTNRAAEEAVRPGAEPPLGNTAKSVRHSEGRSNRFRHQRHAAKLLGGKARVGLCRWSVRSKEKGVDLVASSYGADQPDRVHYEGLQTCGSVWACPCCGARISETRRGEMNQLLAWARAQEYRVMMITLTARHGRDDDLADLLERMKDAKQRWARHRSYRQIKPRMIGSVTATEVTGGGAHGWHPHFHLIVILDGDVDLTPLRDAWLASLRGAGLDGAGAAFQAQGADAAGNYITKWGAAEELTLSQRKKGRGETGRTPGQLLAASCDESDAQAGRLWTEYAQVFHGRRQLVWSRGLKEMSGIGDVDDEEAAQDQQQEDQSEIARANIPYFVWRSGVASHYADERAILLDRAEEVGVDAAAADLIQGRKTFDDVLGITTYSLQNHLRTHVKGMGQIEIDELYVGVDTRGQHYMIPVQAKGGKDEIGIVQVVQDVTYIAQKFPQMRCKAVAAQFMPDKTIALFSLVVQDDDLKIAEERHYKLVPHTQIHISMVTAYV